MYRKVLIAISLSSLVACSNSGESTDMSDVPDAPDALVDSPPDLVEPLPTEPTEPTEPAEPEPIETPLEDEPGTQPSMTIDTSSSPENTQVPVGNNNDTQAIAGSWDFTRDTNDGVDIFFATIGDSGKIVEYDYQQDGIGNQQDCFIVRNTSIAARGANQYDIQDSSSLPGSRGSEDILITIDDGEILFRYFLIDSSLEEGDVLTPRSERFAQSDQDLANGIVCNA